MSNFPKPDELEELLDHHLDQLDAFSSKFNPIFKEVTLELIDKYKFLKSRIEKYAHFSRDDQLKHLILSDVAFNEIKSIHADFQKLESNMDELRKMFQIKQNFF